MTNLWLKIPGAAVAIMLAFLPVAALADDWPQWRGPNRDGVWRESGILETFPKEGLKIRWRAEVGPGYSGVVVAQGRVYVTDCQLKLESVERVLCFDEATGKPLWSYSYPCGYEGLFFGAGPYATPLVHEGKVYVCGPLGHLHCLDAATGRVIWERDRVKEYNAILPESGCNSSPLIEGDLLVVMGGGRPAGCVMAFHKDTGKEMWAALKERPGGSSPIVLEAGGKRQLIVWTLDSVSSLDPATGGVYWRVPSRVINDGGALITPLVYHDRLLLTCEKSIMLKLDPTQPAVTELYRTRASASHFTFVTPMFQDERHFYAAFRDDLCCFDATTGKEVWSAQGVSAGHGNAMFQLTPNGRSVFIFNDEGTLIVARLAPEGYQEASRSFLLEATMGTAQAKTGSRPKTWAHPAYANRHIFARSDKELVCASLSADEPPSPLELASISLRESPGFTSFDSVPCLAFSPDGQTLVTGDSIGKVTLRDPNTGQARAMIDGQAYGMKALAISPDGKLLASCGGNRANKSAYVKLWNLAAGKEQATCKGHTDDVLVTAFSPDGRILATGSVDRTVKLWDVTDGHALATLQGHGDAVTSVAFSPDGQTLASGSGDHTVKIWDVAARRVRATLQSHEDEVLAVAFSPDGRRLATAGADDLARLWDMATGQEQATLRGHRGAIHALAFSPDGRLLATGSGDETVKLWEVATGQPQATLRGFANFTDIVAFSHDGRALVTASKQSFREPVKLWDLVPAP
jgi:outer membrane protein assembly factor BamB